MKKIVDAMGLTCPLPVIETRKALKAMDHGQLEVLVDNSIALQNLEKMAKQLGLTYKSETINERHYRMEIMVGEGVQEQAVPGIQKTEVIGEKVVVLSSSMMGTGDPELGQILLRGFIYALSELDELPAKILMYNTGVQLACTGSDSLADLQALEKRGVEILSCGTCLDFYQLTEDLGVGSITNMYEIVRSTMGAAQVIQP